MNVFNNIRRNLDKLKSLVVTFVIALACLGAAVAATVATLDAAVGLLTQPANGLGDGFMWGLAAAYVAAIVFGAVVFGWLTKKMALVTCQELDKLHDEWNDTAAPAPVVVLDKYDSWVNPLRAGAIFKEGKIDAPEYVLLSMYFINSAAISRIYDLARGRGTTEEERAAISMMQEVSRVLDPKARPRHFRRQQHDLARN